MVIRLQMLLALFGLGLILGCASQPPVLGNGLGASDVAADQARLPSFKIDLYCGREDYDKDLARLMDFAEEANEAMVYADISLHSSGCQCLYENMPDEDDKVLGWIRKLNLRCDISSQLPQASTHCLGSLNLGGAGIGSFCFPALRDLPLGSGYSGATGDNTERIKGRFQLKYVFALGARHVHLLPVVADPAVGAAPLAE